MFAVSTTSSRGGLTHKPGLSDFQTSEVLKSQSRFWTLSYSWIPSQYRAAPTLFTLELKISWCSAQTKTLLQTQGDTAARSVSKLNGCTLELTVPRFWIEWLELVKPVCKTFCDPSEWKARYKYKGMNCALGYALWDPNEVSGSLHPRARFVSELKFWQTFCKHINKSNRKGMFIDPWEGLSRMSVTARSPSRNT